MTYWQITVNNPVFSRRGPSSALISACGVMHAIYSKLPKERHATGSGIPPEVAPPLPSIVGGSFMALPSLDYGT